MVHKNESTAEPINATVRLYLPPYVEYDNKVFNNATVVGDVRFIPEYGGLDIVVRVFDTFQYFLINRPPKTCQIKGKISGLHRL